MKSPEELKEMFVSSGIDLEQPLVASCGSGKCYMTHLSLYVSVVCKIYWEVGVPVHCFCHFILYYGTLILRVMFSDVRMNFDLTNQMASFTFLWVIFWSLFEQCYFQHWNDYCNCLMNLIVVYVIILYEIMSLFRHHRTWPLNWSLSDPFGTLLYLRNQIGYGI